MNSTNLTPWTCVATKLPPAVSEKTTEFGERGWEHQYSSHDPRFPGTPRGSEIRVGSHRKEPWETESNYLHWACDCHTSLKNYRSRFATFDFQSAQEAASESNCNPSPSFAIIHGIPRNSEPRAAFGNYQVNFICHKAAEITCQKGFLCARVKSQRTQLQ